ncbi:sodium:proton exchanger [Putridiphycobacter roseus]|uniref:Sodium:proton exchanger n=1 Tax=Putridiphycobacter roseus TaxID=2219161 RepID=A0A2W1N4W6_9FLAO|nr:cation:proton antiporter [Putridiphycobacter roseus]PZE18854.1 sodium:proton exchanger [Putridiphycobacter roseus]
MTTYTLIIAISSIIIISFIFNIVAKRTNIPSVLLLIGLGVCIKEFGADYFGISIDFDPGILEIIGNVGLVMIVLEAALDLDLKREKMGMIWRSFLVALIALVGSSFAIAYIIIYMIPGSASLYQALIYAIPLSIMSSAIIIPSVGGLKGSKKEFMVYESTFSDILGIMFFYFMLEAEAGATAGKIAIDVGLNIGVTILVSIVLSYILVYIFQKLTSQVKLFLVISVLMMLYALGKTFHLSSLLIILTFGLILNNTPVFFRGRLSKVVNRETVKPIMHDFHILTLESAFVIRTFFFVLFGMFITLSSIVDWRVAVISLAIVGALYVVRFILLKLIVQRDIVPQLYIAPRGLITILLFFVIDSHVGEDGINHLRIVNFDTGILLFVILITSLVMTLGLIIYRGDNVKDVLLNQMPGMKVDKDTDLSEQEDDYDDIIKHNVEEQDFKGF